MPDPISHAVAAAIKIPHIVAGFLGAIISVSFIKEKNLQNTLVILFVGVVSAYFATPAIVTYIPKLDGDFTGFIVGFVAMPIMAGIMKIAEKFRESPDIFIKRR